MSEEILNKEIDAIVNKQSEPLVFTEMADRPCGACASNSWRVRRRGRASVERYLLG
jgi:hypothetical protein